MHFNLFCCEMDRYWNREDAYHILIKTNHSSLDNLYCLDVIKWYSRYYYYNRVDSVGGNKIALALLEDKERISCPQCQNREIVIQKSKIKKSVDVFLPEGNIKRDSFKSNCIEREKCFAPDAVGLIDLHYQSNTYRCTKCNTLFRIHPEFLLSEKSHYTKRFASFLKHFDRYYWVGQNSNPINTMKERWEGLIWNGKDVPEDEATGKKRFDITFATYYNLVMKTSEVKLAEFSENWSDERISCAIRSLPYTLKTIGKI